MDDEAPSREAAVDAWNLICLAASGVAVFATGGLALFAGAVALASLAGSIAASLKPDETDLERYGRECEGFQVGDDDEPAAETAREEGGQSHRWRHSVLANRYTGRSR